MFSGIRISTRPDAVDSAVLERLERYHVTAVELGAQSMCDRVLYQNERGHDAQAVRQASAMLRERGFSLGLQQMVGLYGSTLQDEYDTLEQLLACQPETLRIYPTAVLRAPSWRSIISAAAIRSCHRKKCWTIVQMSWAAVTMPACG